MHSKKWLALLLTLCLVVSVLSPAAYAVDAGGNTARSADTSDTAADAADTADSAPASDETTTVNIQRKTLRDSQAETAGGGETGRWVAQEIDASGLRKQAQLSETLEELQEAAQIYGDSDVVAAFVVMEGQALAEQYTSINAVPEAKTGALLAEQNAVIDRIEASVMNGAALNVRYQFTYLTNAFSVRVPFGTLREIAQVEGVESVYLMPVYTVCEDTLEPNTAVGTVTVGAPTVWEELGCTGAGMTIAIIDTGLDDDHPAFAAAPEITESSLTKEDVAKVIGKLNASGQYTGLTADKLYISEKIPYAFNYVDSSLNTDHADGVGDHGTHVAGIAAANRTEESSVVGAAPDAQIAVMKVFGVNGGAYFDDILAALQDAMILDCDVVNMSLGSPAGFTSASSEVDAVYARIAEQDIIVAVAAGNEATSASGNLWGTDLNRTADPDKGTIGSPATYVNTTSVASVENEGVVSAYFTVDGVDYGYTDASGLYVTFDSLGYEPLEYVCVGGVGTEEDFAAVDVEGKIAVVSRGAINFSAKLANAEAAGAIGLVVYNNVVGDLGMDMTDGNGNPAEGISGFVPAVSVSLQAGQAIAAAEEKTLTIGEGAALVESPTGGQMSTFTSWGTSPDLRLVPDIAGVGGNVYSALDGGAYGVMSGTSMATPQIAGVSALILQYLHENCPELTDARMHEMTNTLMMSTAVPVVDGESGVEASPRQQGAGLVNVADALTAQAYLTVTGSDRPKAELGDDANRTGSWSFTFQVHNLSDEARSFDLSASLLTEDYVEIGGVEFMSGHDCALDGAVTFSRDTVTVPANGSADVTATVSVSSAGKSWLDTHYENGGYVEGYVYLTSGDTVLSLPYMGFYGDWTEAGILDTASWMDEIFWSDDYDGDPTGSQYWNVLWANIGSSIWPAGYNPYTGAPDAGETGIVVSNNGDGYIDTISDFYLSLMRNARNVTLVFSNADTGEVYYRESIPYVQKTMYMSGYGQVVPMVYSWYTDDEGYDFTDAVGKALPNGTRVNMTIYTNLDYDAHPQNNDNSVWTTTVTVDTEAPELLSVEETATADGSYLTITATDNVALAGIQLCNATGSRVVADGSGAEPNEDGTYTVTVDITGQGSELLLLLGDYGVNESAYRLVYTLDDNLPEVDESKLYAYRVFDDDIYSDHMYGWVSIDPETAEVETLTDDYLEYYALTAAEYAGGYVFAVDAGNNLVVMTPGLWNRTTICNLGEGSVLDMTFDKTTRTLYVIHKVDYDVYLETVDLLTGEQTVAAEYYYNGPWVIAAADDGTLYAGQQYSSYLYTLDKENGYAMNYVMDEEGNYLDLGGEERNFLPNYNQSMTFQNGTLYWAYYPAYAGYYGNAALYAVDVENFTFTSTEFASDSEYVGLLCVDNGLADFSCDGGEDCPSKVFTDIDQSKYYHEAVDYVYVNGYMVGTSATTFSPDTNLTRGMMMAVLYRIAGEPAVDGDCPFADVSGYYTDAITWAAEKQIAHGYGDGAFRPDSDITREEMVTFLYRYANVMGYDTGIHYDSLAAFTDAGKVSGYAADAMRWAVGAKILYGTSATTLAPQDPATRAQAAAVVYRLYRNVTGGYRLPINQPLCGITLSSDSLILGVGGSGALTAGPLPWNTALGDVTWSSSDETVAAVEDGVVTGRSVGTATVTAECEGFTAQCQVTVVEVSGTVYAYKYVDGNGDFGDFVRMDLATGAYTSAFDSPVDFIVAEYDGHTGLIYGYDELGQFYRLDPNTQTATALGDPVSGRQLVDMAYDYSTGKMYLATLESMGFMTYSALNVVNLRDGATEMVDANYYDTYMTLACATDGTLYAITSFGELLKISAVEDDWGSYYDYEVVLSGLGESINGYAQSMTWDHNNGKLVWSYTEGSSIFWIDPETGAVVNLGDPTGTGFFLFDGMYTIPDELPERPYVAIEELSAEDMTILTGARKAASLNVYPFNASCNEFYWSSSDVTVATVGADGTVTGRSAGQTVITVTAVDGDNVLTADFTVTVKDAADNLYGFIMADIASYAGDIWAEIPATDPRNPAYCASSAYTVYGAEYYDGKVYAIGYDSGDWTANYQLLALDAETFDILETHDLGADCPSVYDMTYDYTTRTMYALAGYSDDAINLYIVNLTDGSMIPAMRLSEAFMSIAADGKGGLYALTSSEGEYDEWEGTTVYTDAELYYIDPVAGTCDFVGSTGVQSNLLASMAYDYDTGSIYWASLFREGYGSPVSGGLCLIDPATGEAASLGAIGPAGSQVTGMYIISDTFPEEPELGLNRVILSQNKKALAAGGTVQLQAYAVPVEVPADITWSSADPSVATVDENGLVTAVAAGNTTVTATATYNGESCSADCTIWVLSENASFFSYNASDNGFVRIDRNDTTVVEQLSEDSEGEAVVMALESVNGAIYGYDEDYGFFSVDSETYARTEIGTAEVPEDVPEEYAESFQIYDLAYDLAGGRLLALGRYSDEWYGDYESIYQVDLESGSLTLLRSVDYSGVCGMTADENGMVYLYSSLDDTVQKLDMTTGSLSAAVNLQTMYLYGSTENVLSMDYDPIGDAIYILFTGNGSYYRMVSISTETWEITVLGEIGEVYYDSETWRYCGDAFNGLIVIN